MSENKKYIAILILAVSVFINPTVQAQAEKKKLFEEVVSALNQSQNAYADVLCPDEYKKAITHYNNALLLDEQGDSFQEIKTELELAIYSITTANDVIEDRAKTFSKVLSLRTEALDAKADKYAMEFWLSAEVNLHNAIEDFSDKDYEDARNAIPTIIKDYTNAKSYAEYANELVFRWLPLQNANSSLAGLLSPTEYSDGLFLLDEALTGLSEGEEMANIKESVKEAGSLLNKAADNSKKFMSRYSELIRIRKDAQSAGSESFSANLWVDAEETLREAAISFGKGKMNSTVELSLEAQQKYITAKHLAVRIRLFSKADELILLAEKEGADEYAVKTLDESKSLVNNAENIIYTDNYDEINLKEIAVLAEAKANLAIEITQIINSVEDGEATWEDLILNWKDILKKCEEQSIVPYDDKIITEPVVKSEKIPSEVYDIFSAGEAEIIEAGNEVVIRLTGLEFSWLGYTLTNTHEKLLDKAIVALGYFPTSTITVAGHNDYIAAQKFNTEISQRRADNIRNYILSHSNLDPSIITAIGYGEAKSISNDKSLTGRKKNIRIELIIIR